jgi:hypothetical protein
MKPQRSPLAGVTPPSYRCLLPWLLLGVPGLDMIHPEGGGTLQPAKRDRLRELCLQRVDPMEPALSAGDATFVRRALAHIDPGTTPHVRVTFWQSRYPEYRPEIGDAVSLVGSAATYGIWEGGASKGGYPVMGKLVEKIGHYQLRVEPFKVMLDPSNL